MFKLFCFFIITASCWAENRIQSLTIEGNQRIEKKTILHNLPFQVGTSVTPNDIDLGLKALFATGFFADVKIEDDKGVMVVRVVENPTINQIVIEGNRAVTDKILKTGMKIVPAQMCTHAQVQHEVQRMLAIYRAKGYFGARIFPKTIKRPENRVDIIFEVDEGEVTKIASIRFEGNSYFSNWDLSGIISTQESAWWKIFSSADIYDPDRLMMDKEALRKFYLNKGFIDFKLLSVTSELLTKTNAFIITFRVEEGMRYKYGSLAIENHLKYVPTEPLEKAIFLKEGTWYSAEEVEHQVEILTDVVTTLGYAFVDVTPVPVMKNSRVNLTFKIEPGAKLFVRQILVKGNTRTVDSVVRREFTLAEGDAFNRSKIRSSERNLELLGFFKKIEIKEKPVIGHLDQVDLDVKVEEQHTGDINFSVGYATNDGPLGMVRYAERNLFGRGYNFSSGLQIARRARAVNVDLVNPYFMNRPLSVGGGLFYNKTTPLSTYDSVDIFDSKSLGGHVFMAYHLAPYWVQKWSYALSRDQISPGPGVFPLIARDKGRYTFSAVSHTLSYDRRNSYLVPTKGYVVSLDTQFAGIGGNVQYVRNSLNAGYYYPLAEQVVFRIESEGAILSELSKPIRANDKFRAGAESFRGFDYGGIGPHGYDPKGKNVNWNDPLGGDILFITSFQLSFPLGLPEDMAVSGHTFLDVGTVWDSRLSKHMEKYNATHPSAPIAAYNSKKFRASTGVGITWISPMGVIGIDYGWILSKQKGDETRRFLFRVGSTRF